jgi:NTE family protein
MDNLKLVLSGSGTPYPVHVGAIICLAEHGLVFNEVVGTSGGAIVASLLASGYKPNYELIDLMKKTIPIKNKLYDPSIWSLLSKWGFIKGDKIERMLDKYLVKKLKDTKIPLHIVTCNIDQRKMRVFSTATDPNMDISLAVRASMSIPGVFVPVVIDGERYVDGGLAGNFLIDHFKADDMVIGIRIRSVHDKHNKISNAFDYTSAVVDTMLEAMVDERLEDAKNTHVITINTKHNSLNLVMTEADVLDMISEGYNATTLWLRKNKRIFPPRSQ